MRLFHLFLAGILICSSSLSWAAPTAPQLAFDRPNAVFVFMVDQFRADYLTRYYSLLLPPKDKKGQIGGFRYLIENGTYYPYGDLKVAQTLTGPGHSLVSSGSYPSASGIAGNVWYDKKKNSKVYCVEDSNHQLVGAKTSSPHAGTSPANLQGSTLGDVLKNAGHTSRVYSIALKDRAAILMGGHRADLALWFDPGSFQWVSSTYYLPDRKLPVWVTQQNEAIQRRQGETLNWWPAGAATFTHLSRDPKYIDKTDEYAKLIRETFPHTQRIGNKGALMLPFGVEITAALANQAITHNRFGRQKKGQPSPDVLFVSMSSFDYLGHSFGPSSREMEEMIQVVDRALASILRTLHKTVPGGLNKTLVAVTGDHGIPPSPDWLKAKGWDVERLDQDKMRDHIEAKLNKRFGSIDESSWIKYYKDFAFYLNDRGIEDKELDRAAVEGEAKKALQEIKGVGQVFTRSEMESGNHQKGQAGKWMAHSFYSGRSGDLIVIPAPYHTQKGVTVSHSSPFSYDRLVPLILKGPFIHQKKVISRYAPIAGLAPTLSFLLGVNPPSGAFEEPLEDALK